MGRAAAEAEPVVLADAPTAETRAPHFVDWVLGVLPPQRRGQAGVVRATVVLDPQSGAALAVVGSAAKTGTSSGFADTFPLAGTRPVIVAAWAGSFDESGTKGAPAMWSAAPLVRAGSSAVRDPRGAPLTLPAPPEELWRPRVSR